MTRVEQQHDDEKDTRVDGQTVTPPERATASTNEPPPCIQCPFCLDNEYDIEGLKLHLVAGWCDVFNATEVP